MKRSEFVYSREQRYTNVIKSLCTAESSAIQKLSRVCVQQRAALYKRYLGFVYSREQRYTQLSRVCVQQRAALCKSYLEFLLSREQRYTKVI